MDDAERAELIDRYEQGVGEVERALATIASKHGDTALDRRPRDGGWTARRVVHHLADSEMTSAIRLRRLLVEDDPTIGAYDEERFADTLHYDDRPIDASLDAFRAARRTSAEILRRLDTDAWSRAGTHPEHGRYGVEDWLRIYADHAHDHAAQIVHAASG